MPLCASNIVPLLPTSPAYAFVALLKQDSAGSLNTGDNQSFPRQRCELRSAEYDTNSAPAAAKYIVQNIFIAI